MKDDLENYKKRAEMSKELATYFSPFYDISTQSMEEVKTQPMVKENVIDAVSSVKDRDLNLIKKLFNVVKQSFIIINLFR